MSFKRRVIAAIVCLVLILGVTACGASNGSSPSTASPSGSKANDTPASANVSDFKMTIRLGNLSAVTEPPNLAAQYFADKVKERTNGRIEVNVFPSATIGSEIEMIESMQTGMLEMAFINSATLTNFTDTYDVGLLPFLFADRNEAYKLYDSEVGDEMLASLSGIGLKGLTHFENGMRYLINSKKAVVSPADLKGLKIRTMQSEWHLKSFETMGANPTPMAWGDVYTSLQQKVIDGCEIPLTAMVDNKVFEVCGYMTMTGHFYCPYVAMMSQSIWNTIPEADQAIIQEAIIEARDYQREISIEKDEAAMATLRASIDVTEEINIEEWRAAVKPVYEEFNKKFGPEKLARVQEVVAR